MRRIVAATGLLVIPLAVAGAVAWYHARPGPADPLAEARETVGTRAAGPLLAQLVRDHPDRAEVQFLAARQARLEGRPGDAAAHLDRAAALGWPTSQVEREQVLGLAAADFRQARPVLTQLLEADPDVPDLLLALAEGELRAGRAEQAAALAGRALQQTPADCRARHVRGTAWLRARRLDLARADLEAVVAAGPDCLAFGPARLDLATCLLDLGEFGAALALFRAGRDDEPANPLALFGVGRAASYAGQLDEAEQAFRAVLDLRPGHVETLLALAQVVEQRGDLGGAVLLLEQAERGDPARAETHARLAKLLTALGRDGSAAAHEARYREIDAQHQRAAGRAAPPAPKPEAPR